MCESASAVAINGAQQPAYLGGVGDLFENRQKFLGRY